MFGVDIILLNIPRHPKICHLTVLSFTNKYISGRQVTMDYLKESYVFLRDEIRLATMLFFFSITYLRRVEIKKKQQQQQQTWRCHLAKEIPKAY